MFVLFFMMMAVLVMMNVLIILMMVMMFFVMSVFALVMMVVFVLMRMMLVFVRMRVSVCHVTSVGVLMRKVNVEFDSLDGGFMSAGNVQMIAVNLQFLQFVLQVVRVNAQIEQRADKHVAADPAEYVQIQRFHVCSAVVTAPRGFGNLRLHHFTQVAP